MSMASNVIIITGPIGSGKSTACEHLRACGYQTIDLDIVSNNILESKDSLGFLQKNFSECLKDFIIDRKLLADIVFKNPERLKVLEDYLHPLVTEKLGSLIQNSSSDVFVEVSAPKNIHKNYETIVIFSNEEERRERLKSRGMTLLDINNRIKTQPDETWWKSLGNVIENNSLTELKAQLNKSLDLDNE